MTLKAAWISLSRPLDFAASLPGTAGGFACRFRVGSVCPGLAHPREACSTTPGKETRLTRPVMTLSLRLL
jgi:hypothetical protein